MTDAVASILEETHAQDRRFSPTMRYDLEDDELWAVDPALSRRLPIDISVNGGRIVRPACVFRQ